MAVGRWIGVGKRSRRNLVGTKKAPRERCDFRANTERVIRPVGEQGQDQWLAFLFRLALATVLMIGISLLFLGARMLISFIKSQIGKG